MSLFAGRVSSHNTTMPDMQQETMKHAEYQKQQLSVLQFGKYPGFWYGDGLAGNHQVYTSQYDKGEIAHMTRRLYGSGNNYARPTTKYGAIFIAMVSQVAMACCFVCVYLTVRRKSKGMMGFIDFQDENAAGVKRNDNDMNDLLEAGAAGIVSMTKAENGAGSDVQNVLRDAGTIAANKSDVNALHEASVSSTVAAKDNDMNDMQ